MNAKQVREFANTYRTRLQELGFKPIQTEVRPHTSAKEDLQHAHWMLNCIMEFRDERVFKMNRWLAFAEALMCKHGAYTLATLRGPRNERDTDPFLCPIEIGVEIDQMYKAPEKTKP